MDEQNVGTESPAVESVVETSPVETPAVSEAPVEKAE